ncbi:unnamed protein product [Moneuplotes crassus]|uniref:EF-hand domain-containing protein n=1 Tax=Euplotes crassus TaxID=5936 RepID=A0AAD1XG89_EUPCR|nr:unnamed protein product [Moneuplotes crassus]
MLSEDSIENLKSFFIATADHELAIEKQRQYLARLGCTDGSQEVADGEFEPYATFVRLDRENKGYLSPKDFYNFMQENGFDHVTMKDCQYLVKYFDSDEDGVLNYTDYMQLVITCDDTYLRAVVTQRDPYGVNPDEYLSPILERELAILFEKEFAYHREISIICSRTKETPGFSYDKAFIEICNYGYSDEDGYESIDHTSIDNFLRKNGFASTEEELTAIVRRIDVSADGRCSYNEFEESLKPVVLDEPSEYESAPKLSNPSRVKIENLRAGGYMFPAETSHDSRGKESTYAFKDSNFSKKYLPEELPISSSYYKNRFSD